MAGPNRGNRNDIPGRAPNTYPEMGWARVIVLALHICITKVGRLSESVGVKLRRWTGQKPKGL